MLNILYCFAEPRTFIVFIFSVSTQIDSAAGTAEKAVDTVSVSTAPALVDTGWVSTRVVFAQLSTKASVFVAVAFAFMAFVSVLMSW